MSSSDVVDLAKEVGYAKAEITGLKERLYGSDSSKGDVGLLRDQLEEVHGFVMSMQARWKTVKHGIIFVTKYGTTTIALVYGLAKAIQHLQ